MLAPSGVSGGGKHASTGRCRSGELIPWKRSCGKEIMNGKQDYLKGSYYNNPSEDDSNIWPSEEDCPGFKDSFQELCGMMVEIGVLVARACDGFVGEGEGLVGGKTVEALVAGSSASKARLLHYVRCFSSSCDAN